MLAREELLLIFYFIIVILLITSGGILFFITFQRKKNKLLYEKFEAEKRFEEELFRSQLEIQKQTLKNVSWELHDNIGQLLSVANLQLNILKKTVDDPLKSSLVEIKDIVANTLQEVRLLSKSLNHEVVDYSGLEASVKNELKRFDRLNILNSYFTSSGESYTVPQKDAIILFRILQEFLSNVIKHSKADKLEVIFNYSSNELKIEMNDNGIGFNTETVKKNSGLINMRSRAQLINTSFNLTSSTGKGTSLSLNYPIKPNKYE